MECKICEFVLPFGWWIFFFPLMLMNLQNHDLMHLIVAFGFMQPPKNSLDIFTPTWFTSSTFLDKDDHRKFVAGTNFHQVNFNSITCYALYQKISLCASGGFKKTNFFLLVFVVETFVLERLRLLALLY